MKEYNRVIISYFVIKCRNYESLLESLSNLIWSVPIKQNTQGYEQSYTVLNRAFSVGDVYLIVSVNNTRKYQGFAKMKGEITVGETELFDKGMSDAFPVEWEMMFPNVENGDGCSFDAVEELMHENGVPVNKSRNCQELSSENGEMLVNIIKEEYEKYFLEKKLLMEKKERDIEEKKKAASKVQVFNDWKEEEKLVVDENHLCNWFLEKLNSIGDLLFVSMYGSRRYNTSVPGSDVDFVAAIKYPIKLMSGLEKMDSILKNPQDSIYDYSVHAIEHICELLLLSDTKVIEVIYESQDSQVYESDLWTEFKTMVKKLDIINKEVVRKYISEVEGAKGLKLVLTTYEKYIKLKKLAEEGKGSFEKAEEMLKRVYKKWYIIHRCLIHASMILNGEFTVYLPDGSEEQQYLINIRRGVVDHDLLVEEFNTKLSWIKETIKTSSLTENSYHLKETLQTWLFSIRERTDPGISSPSIHNTHPLVEPDIFGVSNFRTDVNMVLYVTKKLAEGKEDFYVVYTRSMTSLLEICSEVITPITNIQKNKKKKKKEEEPPFNYTFVEVSYYGNMLLRGTASSFIDLFYGIF
eukprot:TRINITY_DN2874_c0_g1_i1.p1 TRINITY_DN2874_c0_g1~~TRINITY_DN2874_c0_g1_i1.p1  ORF type:complete len:579 (+),score=127.52 TRINITY_DN2874_c0_g1_i1:207-1943(+)